LLHNNYSTHSGIIAFRSEYKLLFIVRLLTNCSVLHGTNHPVISSKTRRHHLPYTSRLPTTYLRAITCIVSTLNNAEVTHQDGRRYEAFSLQVYRKGERTKSKDHG